MFKPNRVGTPKFFEQDKWNSVTIPAGAWNVINSGLTVTNLNATPLGEVGYGAYYFGTIASVASQRIVLVQTFNIDKPPNADAIGVELEASISGTFAPDVMIVPVFGRYQASLPGAAMSPININGSHWRYIGQKEDEGDAARTAVKQRYKQYSEQVVTMRETVNWTYFHGFEIRNTGLETSNMGTGIIHASVRQQQGAGGLKYFDSAR